MALKCGNRILQNSELLAIACVLVVLLRFIEWQTETET